MKILESGKVTIDVDPLVFSYFNFSGPLEVPGRTFAYDAATLAGLDWIEERVAQERALVMARIKDRQAVNLSATLEPAPCGYHQMLQAELNKRPELRAKPMVGLTAEQLLAISRRALPVFNRHTGERIV